MKGTASMTLLTAACLLAIGFASVAHSQAPAPQTPRGWSYEVDKRGNRITRDNRVVKADGSWREEIRQGNCITVKERSATGEYKETRQCNAASPR